MSKDLLIYTTVANWDNEGHIEFTALVDLKTKRYSMPSIVVKRFERIVYTADSPAFLIRELLPALKAYVNRSLTDKDKEALDGLAVIHEDNHATELIDILEYAIENNLLNETM